MAPAVTSSQQMAAYYRGTNYSDLNDNILVNWKSGRCPETVAYRKGGRTGRFGCFHFPVSLRVGSLSVLFARVSWRRSRDFRATEWNGARKSSFPRSILLADPLRSPGRKSRLRGQITCANNTLSEPVSKLFPS